MHNQYHLTEHTLNSVPGMQAFVQACRDAGGTHDGPALWQNLAVGAQLAGYLGDTGFGEYCVARAHYQNNQLADESDEALYAATVCGDQLDRLSMYLLLPCMTGHYVATQLAERAYRLGQAAYLEAAVDRLLHCKDVLPRWVDAGYEYAIAEVMLVHLTTGHLQWDRLRELVKDNDPLQCQRKALDVARIFNGLTYGGRA